MTTVSAVLAMRSGRAQGQSVAPAQVVFHMPRDTGPSRLARFAFGVLERERLRGALERRPGVYGPRDPRAYIGAVKRLLDRTGHTSK